MKDKEANRFAIEKTQIEVLIEKHRPRTPKTPDEVSTSGTGKNANVDGQEGCKALFLQLCQGPYFFSGCA